MSLPTIYTAGPILTETTKLAAITLVTDSATVGKTRTFVPLGYNKAGDTVWEHQVSDNPRSNSRITLKWTLPNATAKNYKLDALIETPIMETPASGSLSGYIPEAKVAYTLRSKHTFWMPDRSSLNERIALINISASLYATTITASDGNPSDATNSPLYAAVTALTNPTLA